MGLIENSALRLEARVEELQAERARTRTDHRKALARRDREGLSGGDDSTLFENPADQLNFEINMAWARITQPSEKKDLPLKQWSYSRHFFDTLQATQGINRTKVIEVIVHVLTGRDKDLHSRELHQLRTGPGGEDPPRTRNNGSETCWRVSLQTKTPSARRLHYWQCVDGSIELSSVRLHDDNRP